MTPKKPSATPSPDPTIDDVGLAAESSIIMWKIIGALLAGTIVGYAGRGFTEGRSFSASVSSPKVSGASGNADVVDHLASAWGVDVEAVSDGIDNANQAGLYVALPGALPPRGMIRLSRVDVLAGIDRPDSIPADVWAKMSDKDKARVASKSKGGSSVDDIMKIIAGSTAALSNVATPIIAAAKTSGTGGDVSKRNVPTDDIGAMPVAAIPVLHFAGKVAASAIGGFIAIFATDKLKTMKSAPPAQLPAKTSGVEGVPSAADLGWAATMGNLGNAPAKKDCGCDDCQHDAEHGHGDEPCTAGCSTGARVSEDFVAIVNGWERGSPGGDGSFGYVVDGTKLWISATDEAKINAYPPNQKDAWLRGKASKMRDIRDEDGIHGDVGWAKKMFGYDVTMSVTKATDTPEQKQVKADADKATAGLDKLKTELDKVSAEAKKTGTPAPGTPGATKTSGYLDGIDGVDDVGASAHEMAVVRDVQRKLNRRLTPTERKNVVRAARSRVSGAAEFVETVHGTDEAGVGAFVDDMFKATSGGGHAVLKVFAPGVADDVQKLTHKIKRQVDDSTGHPRTFDDVLDAPTPAPGATTQQPADAPCPCATTQKPGKADPNARAMVKVTPPSAQITVTPGTSGSNAGKGHDMTIEGEHDDMGAAAPRHTTLRKGQQFTAQRNGDWVVNQGDLAKWIRGRCGRPGALSKARAQVRRFQRSAQVAQNQLQQARMTIDQLQSALAQGGQQFSVPDFGPMPDFSVDPTLEQDFADVADDYGDDDFLNGVQGISGIFSDDLGATAAERAAIARGRGDRRLLTHDRNVIHHDQGVIRHDQGVIRHDRAVIHHDEHTIHALRAELAHKKHELAECQHHHGSPQHHAHAAHLAAIIPAMEHALEQAIHFVQQSNHRVARRMVHPDGLNGVPEVQPPAPPTNLGNGDVGKGYGPAPVANFSGGGGFHGGGGHAGWGRQRSPGWGGQPWQSQADPYAYADPYGDPDMMMGTPPPPAPALPSGARPPANVGGYAPPAPVDNMGGCGGTCPTPALSGPAAPLFGANGGPPRDGTGGYGPS